jgi:hypothetical protein
MNATKAVIAGLFLTVTLATLPAFAESIQLERQHGVFMVPVRINDAVVIPFVLDSGAAEVQIPTDVFLVLRRAGTVGQSDFVGTGTYILADGSRQSSERFILRKVSVGSYVITNVVANVASAKGDPLLGQSFLSRLPQWAIDNSLHALVISGAAPPQTAAIGSSSGAQPQPPSTPLLAPIVPQFGAGAYGAFAYADGPALFGFSWNQPDQPNADYGALKGCASSECKIVFRTGPRECGAIAMNDSGKIWGGAKRGQPAAAELAAVENCQQRATGQCKVRGSECNR